MTHWLLALKRFLRPGTLAMLLVVALTAAGGKTLGRQAALRPCGLVCLDDHPAAQQVRQALLEKGFAPYDSREAMEEDISMGILDCGAVLREGIGQGVEQAEYAGFVELLTAPDSFLTEAYQAHIVTALYTAAAPAMVGRAAQEAQVPLTQEDIRRALAEMMEEGYRFSFEVETTQGPLPQTPDRGQALALAGTALLLFAAVVPGAAAMAAEADRLWGRIGRRAALTRVLLPGLCWQSLAYSLAAGPLLGRAGWAVPGYVLALTALALVAARLPVGLKPLLPLVLLGSLALYPIYYDLVELYPRLALLRRVLPPCWLLLFEPQPLLWAVVGALAAAGLLAVYPRRRLV